MIGYWRMSLKSKYFVVSLDTERDHGPGWRPTHPARFRSILESIPKSFQPLCDRYGVRPTYLLTTEVMADPSCQEVLLALGSRAELGTHLHMETSLIDEFRVSPAQRNDYFSGLCPEPAERMALEKITTLFIDVFKTPPRSFRAGRYGATTQTLKILQDLKYWVDSSVTPGIRWKNRQGSVDFRDAPRLPFYPDLTNHIAQPSKDETGILEVPVSIVTDSLSWRWPFIDYPVWLRPSHSSRNEMRRVLDTLERFAEEHESPVVANMMFHSMELFPNASPYASTQKDVDRYLDDLSFIFELVKSRNYQCIGLSEVKSCWFTREEPKPISQTAHA